MDTLNAFGLTAPMVLHYTTTMISLNKHGETNTMVSRQIANLSQEDLTYLETLLGKEFANINERKQQFKSKNGWCPGDNSQRVLRLLNAIRSQRRVASIDKW